jgi:hypothetical protein
VQVLALLKADRYKRFRASLAPNYEVRSVDLAKLEVRLAQPDAKLVVVDPSRIRPEAFIALVGTARTKGNAAVLVHAPLTSETARVVVEASRIQPIEAVFFGSYDERDALAQVCKQLMVPSVPALVLRGLAANLAEMPPLLATRIVGLFGGQPFPSSTSAMLDGLGVSTDTARQWLTVAGITHPHHLRSCAVLARTFPALGRQREPLAKTVEHFDAGSERGFRRTCETLTRLTPRHAGRLTGVEFAARLLSVVLGPHDPDRGAIHESGRKRD